ncbi:hypothetical protein HNY73_008087 [Argiope bruennichi]|uniref:Uncharacterized protein n=1 Tax=Argiope bruennichi TaxID=94029 RepID=A0A8T0F582_ARGBR|nr:hypothetical protein HNY73_008087 [Argiope bruennichi]
MESAAKNYCKVLAKRCMMVGYCPVEVFNADDEKPGLFGKDCLRRTLIAKCEKLQVIFLRLQRIEYTPF